MGPPTVMSVGADGSIDSGRSRLEWRGRPSRVSTGFGPPEECRVDASTDNAAAVKRVVSGDPDTILARSAHLGPPTDDFGAVGDATTGSHNIQRREHGMNADVRSKLEMAEHVRVFNRAHPASDTGTQLVFAQFDESIARANALITEQAQGNQRSRTANASRRELRNLLGVGLLRVIGNVCHAAAREDASLGTLKTPPRRAPNRVYIAGAEALVTGARVRLEGLTKHGLTGELLDEAAKVVAQYQAATEEASAAKQGRIQASAELDEVAARIMELVNRMDGLNRHRFVNQPDVLASWESARNLVTVAPKANSTSVPPSGAGGDVRAAA